MLPDFFTKPLQGTPFTRMRDKILNLSIRAGSDVHRSMLERKEFAATEAEGINNGTRLVL